ncbi:MULTISPECIES: sensor histidine kinase [Ralstonia]|uniref:sensor histidine kinase n=1 Tax=Ralstonia TaxID=48736 RepID=UPI000A677FF4|nr:MULTISPECIES: sensor histidine kinase [Ralstonia]PLT17178.1 ATP-binding protein [Ralstonia mannitolilytica]
MNSKTVIGEFPFSVEARVAIQLGRESVSSSLVAIIELVKNAYDADASRVDLEFIDLEGESPRLVISDDGTGMDRDALINQWMRIGTTNKVDTLVSGKQRVLTGAKGLGRLGLDRLCEHLTLQTKIKGAESLLELTVDWGKYSHQRSAGLDEIRHTVYEVALDPTQENAETLLRGSGSRYVMSGLKDRWGRDSIFELRRELSLLVSPFSRNLDFVITVQSGLEGADLNGPISSDHMLEAAEWRLQSSINNDNSVSLKVSSGDGNPIFEQSNVKWADWIKTQGPAPACGAVAVDIYFMRNTSREVNGVEFRSRDIRNFLANNQGVRIYRDHFRVKPYGDPSGRGDWLNLAMRRVKNPEGITQPGWRIGYNQIVGAVFISRQDNPNLIDQTNREGLTEGAAYFDLRAFLLKCIELFEQHIQAAEQKKKELAPAPDPITQVDENVSGYKEIIERIAEVSEHVDAPLKAKLADINKALGEQTKKTSAFSELIVKLEKDKDTLANLASLGILTVSFGHETLASISTAKTSSHLLKDAIVKGMFMLEQPVVDFALRRLQSIENSVSYVSVFGNFALGNVRRDKRTRKKVDVARVLKSVFSGLHEMLERRGIKVNLQADTDEFIVRSYEIDWESIFANLITNACWALEDTPNEQRSIAASLWTSNGQGFIDFEDSGRGIEVGTEDHIFLPAYTTKRNKKGDAVGTGMGLAIVKTFVEDHSGGAISLMPKGSLGGAKFRITVPLRVGDIV